MVKNAQKEERKVLLNLEELLQMIIKNNIIPFGGYKVINLFGLIFTKSDLTDEDKNHENIHSV